jgi:hypothetical protein
MELFLYILSQHNSHWKKKTIRGVPINFLSAFDFYAYSFHSHFKITEFFPKVHKLVLARIDDVLKSKELQLFIILEI